jgi:hypothetical protein
MATKTGQKQWLDPFSARAIETGNLSEWTPVPDSDKEKITDSAFEPLSGSARYGEQSKKTMRMKQQLERLKDELQPDWAKKDFASGNLFSILDEE